MDNPAGKRSRDQSESVRQPAGASNGGTSGMESHVSTSAYPYVLHDAPNGMCLTDADGIYQMVSPVYCGIFGYAEHELLGRCFLDVVIPPEKRSDYGRLYRLLFERQVPDRDVISIGEALLSDQLLRKDGILVSAEFQTVFLVREGRPSHVLTIVTDVSSRVKAEDALRSSEQRYRALAESAQDFIFIIGRDSHVEYVNTFGASQLGKRPEEIVGKPRAALFPPGVSERQAGNLGRVFDSGETLTVRQVTPIGGHDRWLDTRLVPIRDEKGVVTSVLGISRDVTERVKAEDALRASERRYRTLAESAQASIFIINREDEIEYVNSYGAGVLGLKPEEMIGRRRSEFFTPETGARLRENLWNVFENGRMMTVEELAEREGAEYWRETQFVPLRDEAGDVISVLGIARDITERKRLEEAKTNFLGSISHELRAPLTSILGFSELLLKDNLPEAVKQKLRIILERGRQELKLVNDLIALAASEYDGATYEMADRSVWHFLSKYVREAPVVIANLMEKRHGTSNFTFEREIASGLKGVTARFDEKRLRQVLDNLVENAVKYSPAGQSHFKISAERRDGSVVIGVHDRGIGIPPEEHETIFQPFYQVRGRGKAFSDGLGKGLSIVKEFIEAHGGAVWLESKPQEGSAFYVSLPVLNAPAAETPRATTRVLVVDDDRDMAQFVQDLLSKNGWDVEIVFNGADAFAHLERHKPDLVILDLNMPDMQGDDVCRALKSDAARASIPVLMFSVRDPGELECIARAAGADAWISKPFEIDAFVRQVEKLLK